MESAGERVRGILWSKGVRKGKHRRRRGGMNDAVRAQRTKRDPCHIYVGSTGLPPTNCHPLWSDTELGQHPEMSLCIEIAHYFIAHYILSCTVLYGTVLYCAVLYHLGGSTVCLYAIQW